jgi:hypothetical protein
MPKSTPLTFAGCAVESWSAFLTRNGLISLKQLCLLVGRTPQSIRRWEAGAEPRFPKACFIAKRKYWLRKDVERFLREISKASQTCSAQDELTADNEPRIEEGGC